MGLGRSVVAGALIGLGLYLLMSAKKVLGDL
jgi:hypothetical protein